MNRLLLSILFTMLIAGPAMAGEGHDHSKGNAHEPGHDNTMPETEAFYGDDTRGAPVKEEHPHDHGTRDKDDDHGHSGHDEDDEDHEDDHEH